MGLGAIASVVQSGLFVVIGLCGLGLGLDRVVTVGLAAARAQSPTLFALLCASFILVAVLGFAITPAERQLVARHAPGLADFGAALALFGHAGTVAFFAWWLLAGMAAGAGEPFGADRIAPVRFGMMFELVFVGAWVWIIAWIGARHPGLPRSFVGLSIAKAGCFWLTFAAIVLDRPWLLLAASAATTLAAGPAWHLWIARLLLREADPAGRVHG